MSAEAGSAGIVDETKMEERARAADQAFNDPFSLLLSSVAPEQTMLLLVITFNLDPNCEDLEISSGWKKLVEIVKAISSDLFVEMLERMMMELV